MKNQFINKNYAFLNLVEFSDNNLRTLKFDIGLLNSFNIENYNYFLGSVFETILNNFKIKNKEISLFLDNKFLKNCTISELYTIVIFLKANIEYKVPIKSSDIISGSNITVNNIHDNIERILLKFEEYFEKNSIHRNKLGDIAADIIENLTKLSIIYSWLNPTSISLYDIIQFAKRNATFDRLINMRINNEMSIKEIENLISVVEKELIDCILEDKNNCLYQYVKTGSISFSQLRQMFTFVGTRLDIDKTILPYPIKGNFLRGLEDVVELYSESVVARNALTDKEKHIRTTGYESRKMDLLCLGTRISRNIKDCKTKHFLTLEINDNTDLNIVKGKYQILNNGELHVIDSNKDKHLIGKKINIRSHSVCALKHNEVCQICYGSTAKRLFDIDIGAFPSSQIQNTLSNKTISSKHYLDTNSSNINSKTIEKFFVISQDKLFLRSDVNYSGIKLIIDKLHYENMLENYSSSENTDDYDLTPLENVYLEETIIDKKTNKIHKENYYFDDINNIFLYLSSEILSERSYVKNSSVSDIVEVHLSKIDLITPIIDLRMRSEDITYQVNKFIELIDSKYTETYIDYNIFIKELIKIIKEVKISTSIVYLETIMFNIIKDANNLNLRPDFTKSKVDFKFLPIKKAIMLKDVYTSFSFERYNNQLKNMSFFERGDMGSTFMPFFKTNRKLMK